MRSGTGSTGAGDAGLGPVWGRQFDATGGTVVAVIHTERWLDAVSSHVESLQRQDAGTDSR